MKQETHCFKCNAKLEDYVLPTGGYAVELHYIIMRMCPTKHEDPINTRDHYVRYIKDLGKYSGELWR